MRDLEGKVAVVSGGGSPLGRAIALRLSAQGAPVVVQGGPERALGETVGEIVYGGGKARHVPGDLDAAIARALEVFQGFEVLVVTEGTEITDESALSAATGRVREGGHVVVVASAIPVAGIAKALEGRKIAVHSVDAAGGEPEDVAVRVAKLCAQ